MDNHLLNNKKKKKREAFKSVKLSKNEKFRVLQTPVEKLEGPE